MVGEQGVRGRHITYIIIKKIEINIRCKLIGQNLQLTFYVFRFSEHFVTVPLGRDFGKPLADIRAHSYSHSQTLAGFTFFPAPRCQEAEEKLYGCFTKHCLNANG